ncbi:hypothetical protein [Scandinavium goeteborgense]|uniref:hypothetical protein n=1 Tax=Scandinavium goeteborgense TaxID=1851514 RepID=UPI001571E31B|nr:hypothetical protein [Scandinavium goeteborgense]QKN80955.1 hypothetical protein A8O29_006525 [Scandinavium goeteborgense]
MEDKGNSAYHRPVWDDKGQYHYDIIPQPKENNDVAICFKLPEKVIPVIFIPGGMGSNMKGAYAVDPVARARSVVKVVQQVPAP